MEMNFQSKYCSPRPSDAFQWESLSRIRNHFVEGGDAGNREEYVNELIKRML
jgi:hypothetical protein